MISLQVNVKSFKEKRVVTVFGYEIQLTCSARKKGIVEVCDNVEEAHEGGNGDEDKNEEEGDEGDSRFKEVKFYHQNI